MKLLKVTKKDNSKFSILFNVSKNTAKTKNTQEIF
jgi:hypothetical protein